MLIVLISCVSKKRSVKSKARDLYTSALFKKNLGYAFRLSPARVYILSAKYGLVELEEEIEPYNKTLNTMPVRESREWAGRVLQQLAAKTDLENDRFVFLAGKKYRRYLVPHMKHFEIPLEGLRIGEQLQKLSRTGEEING